MHPSLLVPLMHCRLTEKEVWTRHCTLVFAPLNNLDEVRRLGLPRLLLFLSLSLHDLRAGRPDDGPPWDVQNASMVGAQTEEHKTGSDSEGQERAPRVTLPQAEPVKWSCAVQETSSPRSSPRDHVLNNPFPGIAVWPQPTVVQWYSDGMNGTEFMLDAVVEVVMEALFVGGDQSDQEAAVDALAAAVDAFCRCARRRQARRHAEF